MFIHIYCERDLTPFHQIWSTSTLSLLYTIHPHGETEAGDIFSLAYSPPHSPTDSGDALGLNALFFGCQNTSLQWLDLSRLEDYSLPRGMGASTSNVVSDRSGIATPEAIPVGLGIPTVPSPGGLRKLHKFFDSEPRAARTRIPDPTIQTVSSSENANLDASGQGTDVTSACIPGSSSCASLGGDAAGVPSGSEISKIPSASSLPGLLFTPINDSGRPNDTPSSPTILQVPPGNVIESAHFGYV